MKVTTLQLGLHDVSQRRRFTVALSKVTRAVLSPGRPRDAAVNFGIAVSCGFDCDTNALKLNNSIYYGKITVLNISIYCL